MNNCDNVPTPLHQSSLFLKSQSDFYECFLRIVVAVEMGFDFFLLNLTNYRFLNDRDVLWSRLFCTQYTIYRKFILATKKKHSRNQHFLEFLIRVHFISVNVWFKNGEKLYTHLLSAKLLVSETWISFLSFMETNGNLNPDKREIGSKILWIQVNIKQKTFAANNQECQKKGKNRSIGRIRSAIISAKINWFFCVLSRNNSIRNIYLIIS